MNMLHQLDRFHKTTIGYLLFGAVELGLAYVFVSLAIDRGNLFYYLLALILFIGTLQNLFKFIGTLFHGSRKTSRTR